MSNSASMLRLAIEGFDNAPTGAVDHKNVTITGPLGLAMYEALNITYAKNDHLTGRPVHGEENTDPTQTEPMVPNPVTPAQIIEPPKPALESQAQDAQILAQIAELVLGPDDTEQLPENVVTVYGTSRTMLTNERVVEVTDAIAQKPNKTDFVLVVDGASPEVLAGDTMPNDALKAVEVALETIVEAHGGTVYRSFADFVHNFLSR